MSDPIRFGLFLPQETGDTGLLREIAQTAERGGFHSLWLYDHFYNYPTPGNATVLEAFTAMSWLAGCTRSIRIGALVFCDGYRNPALTAKMAATLDVLSDGRLEFGYGAGWHELEYRGYGYDFPPVATRIAMMEEALTIITKLWQGEPASFDGKHYRIADALCQPTPLQRPRPPITIGGGGEKLLLRAVARHADIWNYFPGPLPEYERKLGILKEHCQREGRDLGTMQQSLLAPLVTAEWEKEVRDQLEGAKQRGLMWANSTSVIQGTPDIVVPRLRDYARRGVSAFILALPDARDLKRLEFVSQAVVAELR
jgi:F420-dependent oxidoreductase-like protein